MTPQTATTPRQRMEKEILVISEIENGFRVYSPKAPGNSQYVRNTVSIKLPLVHCGKPKRRWSFSGLMPRPSISQTRPEPIYIG